MRPAVLVAGILAQVLAWRLAATDRIPFWSATAATWAVAGLAAVLAGDPGCCHDVAVAAALAVGLGSGVVLYAATRVVVEVAVRLAPILKGVVDGVYAREREASPAVVWTVTLLIVVPAEELFWRGLALPELQRAVGPVAGAVLLWLTASAVAAAWTSLPFLAAAVVGGAVWTALGTWSGGVVAPFASHVVWTAAMIAWRPRTGRAKVPS
jgi:membrane protease YdiL (CAAX protease family)